MIPQDEIAKLARKAGVVIDANQSGFDSLVHFAALVAAAALTKTTPDAWQEAVQDRLVVVHGLTDENANDPRKAIADLIRAETQIALDPAVSSDAHALIAAEREACAKVCDTQGVGRKALEHYAALTYSGAAHDCAAATRRAIARVAAEIGKGMP